MPYFKKNEGFKLGFSPYTSPFKYSAHAQHLKSIKHGMANAKFDYKNRMATGTNSPSARKGYRQKYNQQMSELRSQYKQAQQGYGAKKKYTLNPFKATVFGL